MAEYKLTAQQDAFAWAIATGSGNSDAYRQAYNAENMNLKSISVEAARLRQRPDIALAISQYQITIGERKIYTLEEDIAENLRIKELALSKGNFGAAAVCQKQIGQLSGHYREQIDVTVNDEREKLSELEKLSPDLAKAYANKLGVPWSSTLPS